MAPASDLRRADDIDPRTLEAGIRGVQRGVGVETWEAALSCCEDQVEPLRPLGLVF